MSAAAGLARHRGAFNRAAPPRLLIKQILAWADAHHLRTGEWPTKSAGGISESRGETWWAVDQALTQGTRSLRGGSSLAALLLTHRDVRSNHTAPVLTMNQILRWAREHFSRTDKWPTSLSGAIPTSVGDTWKGIDYALRAGRRGLAGGSSVAKLLAEQGWKINPRSRRELALDRVLRWADIHREETGEWPTSHSGKVHHVRGETWVCVDTALRRGLRGLGGGSSLAQLLASRREARNPAGVPSLSEDQILKWADAHRARSGQWPRIRSGCVGDAPKETWKNIHGALLEGGRGLAGGSSLARLLATHRGVPNGKALPALTPRQILAWADAHHRHTGCWPTPRSGPIPDAIPENWRKVDGALRTGFRGLVGGSSLFRFLQTHRRKS